MKLRHWLLAIAQHWTQRLIRAIDRRMDRDGLP